MSESSNIVLLITAENKASQVLQQVQEQASQTEERLTTANNKIAESTQRLNVNILGAAQAFAGVGAGAVGLATSFDTLERAQVRVDVAQKNLVSAQVGAMQAQDAYSKAVQKFGPDSQQAHQALLRLETAQKQVGISQDKARLAQDQLGDTYANFAAGIAPQTISLIFGIQGAFRALGVTSTSQIIPAISGIGNSFIGLGGSSAKLIPAITGIGTALKTTFLTNPVGIAILGISTVVALLAFNVGGLRDKLVDLGQQILAFLDAHLKPLADAIRWVADALAPLGQILGLQMPEQIGNTQTAIDQAKQSIDEITPSVSNLSTELDPNLTDALTGAGISASEMGNKIADAKEGIDIFDSALTEMTKITQTNVSAVVSQIISFSNKVEEEFAKAKERGPHAYAQAHVTAREQIQQILLSLINDYGFSIAEIEKVVNTLPPIWQKALHDITTNSQLAMTEYQHTIKSSVDYTVAEIENMLARVNTATQQAVQNAVNAGATVRRVTSGGAVILNSPSSGGTKMDDADLQALGFSPDEIRALRVEDAGAVATRMAVRNAAVDQYGRLIDARTGQPLSTGPTSFGEDLYYKGVYVGVGSGLGGIPKTAGGRANLDAALRQRGIPAQHGFEGIFDRPTFLPLIVGEGGVKEHVRVTPMVNNAMKLVVQFVDPDGSELGSHTLDMMNKEAVIRIKTRGVRMI
jgi:hypothetical protein